MEGAGTPRKLQLIAGLSQPRHISGIEFQHGAALSSIYIRSIYPRNRVLVIQKGYLSGVSSITDKGK